MKKLLDDDIQKFIAQGEIEILSDEEEIAQCDFTNKKASCLLCKVSHSKREMILNISVDELYYILCSKALKDVVSKDSSP